MALEAGKKVAAWTLVSNVDSKLKAPLWTADDGERLSYIRHYKVRNVAAVRRCLKVADMAKTFDHDHVVPLKELIEVPGGVAAISAYEEGQPLASVLGRARLTRKLVPIEVAVAITLDILDGLRALGGRLTPAWVHGGLRPEAILLTRGGRARLMDVGVCAEAAAADPLGQEADWLVYAAPEHLASGGRATTESDIFSLGCILWEMLVGRPLFSGRSRAAIEKAMKRAGDRTPKTKRAPAALGAIVAQCVETDPDDRYEDHNELTNALHAACEDVAEPVDVSEYLESLQTVAMDKRRRVLKDATGRAAPRSLPPPAKKRSRPPTAVKGFKMSEPPKIKRARPAPSPGASAMVPKPPAAKVPAPAKLPAEAKPVESEPPPEAAKSERPPEATESEPPPEATESEPPPEAAKSEPPPEEPAKSEPPRSEPPESEPPKSEEVVFSEAGLEAPDGEAPDAEPSMSEEVVFSEAGLQAPDGEAPDAEPSMSEEVVFSEAGLEAPEAEPSLSEEVVFSEAGLDRPPSDEDADDEDEAAARGSNPFGIEDVDSRFDVDVDDDFDAPAPDETPSEAPPDDDAIEPAPETPAPETPAPDTTPSASQVPAPTASPKPAAVSQAPAAAPNVSQAPAAVSQAPAPQVSQAPAPLDLGLDLDDDDLALKPPSRWPTFLFGLIVGAAIVLALHYGGILPPP